MRGLYLIHAEWSRDFKDSFSGTTVTLELRDESMASMVDEQMVGFVVCCSASDGR